jgi:hypothetical protein
MMIDGYVLDTNSNQIKSWILINVVFLGLFGVLCPVFQRKIGLKIRDSSVTDRCRYPSLRTRTMLISLE